LTVGFTGLRNEGDLVFARGRYLSPGLGRWIGRDPAGYVDGSSLYLSYFVPNKADPSGFKEEDISIIGRMWIDGSAIYSNWGEFSTNWLGFAYDPVAYRAFLFGGVFLGDQGSTSTLDYKFRVQHEKTFKVECKCKKIKILDRSVNSWTGKEGPFQAEPAVFYGEKEVNVSEDEINISYGIYGHPPQIPELGIQSVRTRESVNIWQYVQWKLKCNDNDNDSVVSTPIKITTSNFPSHVFFDKSKSIVWERSQGPITELWKSHPGFPTFVIGY
jgi:hypothetical protein